MALDTTQIEDPAPLNIHERASGWRKNFETEYFLMPRVSRAVLSQLPLTVTTVVAFIFLLLVDPALATDRLFVMGAVGVMVLTVIAWLLRWSRVPSWCVWLIPLADFVPIGAMVHGANQTLSGLTLLAVFPVLWLAWSDISVHVTRTVAFFGPLMIAWAPFIFAGVHVTRGGLIRPLLIPTIMFALAVAATVVTRSLKSQAERLRAVSADAQRHTAQLNSILNVAEVGVVVVDADGHDVLMNRRQQTIHAVAVPEGVADPAEDQLLVFNPDRITPTEPSQRPVRRAVCQEEFSDELYWLGSGSRQRAYLTSARQIIDTDGVRQGAVVVFHDATEVMEAVAAQEQLVASVSHELRTPLTSILGYLGLALDEALEESTARYLAVVSRNTERLLALVNDLLGTASKALTVNAVQGDLHAVLVAAVEAARPTAYQRGIEVRLDADASMVGSFDTGRMSQAVDNLVSNAIKFSPRGGVVDVIGRCENGELAVSVRDQGAGISAEDQNRLFTRFYRTTSAVQSAVPGTGLGLAITKAIVSAHGGALAVDSAPSQGSTFTITIPA